MGVLSADPSIVGRRHLVVFSLVVGLALAVTAAAFGDHYVFRRTAADESLARSLLLQHADFPALLKLNGGRIKPDESIDPCDFSKRHDLVVSGDAEARFSNPSGGIAAVESSVGVFQTEAMARTDWSRELEFSTAKSVACSLGKLKDHLKLVAFKALGPARCACDESLSLLLETTSVRKEQRLIWAVTMLRRGRIGATVETVVAGAATDTSNAALNAAVGIQGAAVSAISKRLARVPSTS